MKYIPVMNMFFSFFLIKYPQGWTKFVIYGVTIQHVPHLNL